MPATAEALTPRDHPFGSKRPCLETGYYATFNRANVSLVNLRQEPIEAITAAGIRTGQRIGRRRCDRVRDRLRRHDRRHPGGSSDHRPRRQVDRGGVGERAADLSRPHRGRLPQRVPGHRPGQPVGAVEHGGVDRAACRLGGRSADRHACAWGSSTIEATETAQAGWARHLADCAALSLHRLANTWYTGANVPGKARGVMPYTGGVGPYRTICDEVVEPRNAGVQAHRAERRAAVQRWRDRAPAARRAAGARHAGGPEAAADRIDGCRGRARLRRPVQRDASRRSAGGRRDRRRDARRCRRSLGLPSLSAATPGPHPIVVYFHGGGWVLGDAQSDDPFCRDLCRRRA